MPTYRVMDSDGVIVDKNRKPSDVTEEEVLMWYKNMLTGMESLCRYDSGEKIVKLKSSASGQ